MSRVLLGVAGGIAAYKTCSLVRMLRADGHDVWVVPTRNALKFVGAATWEALSGHPVTVDVWAGTANVQHVELARQADLVFVAPATADLLARAAAGRADDLLATVLITVTCPVVLAPAMHTAMWLNPATQANVATLRDRGVAVLEPASGRLTGPDSGPGRMAEPEDLHAVLSSALERPDIVRAMAARDLAGLRVLISAGGTREALDPVRYLGNASSGIMGFALARAAVQRGASVTLVGANLSRPGPAGVEVVEVVSTADLAEAMTVRAPEADLVVMAAAPADFTPARPYDTKIKKDGEEGLTLELVQTVDVLAALAAARPSGQVIVGFAAETTSDQEDLLELGRAKLARKGCQLLVVNDVSDGRVFGAPGNDVVILDAAGVAGQASGSKDLVAHAIFDAALRHREAG